MESKILSNPEVKSAFMKFVVFACIFIVLAIACFLYSVNDLNHRIINNNLSVMGNLIKKHPEFKDDIVSSFTHAAGTDDFENGIAASKAYGYSSNLPVVIIPLMSEFQNRESIILSVILLLFFVFFLMIIYSIFKRMYLKIREATSVAEKIVEGDFTIKLDEESEGDLSKLGYQFNRMSKQLMQSLEKLNNEKVFLKNIISDISHQLKTPLASIKVYNEILLGEKAENTDDRIRFLNKSQEQIDRMEWLVQNLLMMARIESGAIEFHNEYIPLVHVLEKVVENLRDKWELKRQYIRIIYRDESVHLMYDEKWLAEAIGNIVKNSIEHTGDDGKIDIEVAETPIMVSLIIKDNGEGISKEDLPHIFKRFYKGKHNSSTSSSTGIGLSLAKAIIENEGGVITVRSVLNEGTVFTINFPKGNI